jgi:murein L,D-transpeptidase YcbB/YkuD
VPRSIIKEILPQIQADSLYLRKHNYQVLDYAGTMLDATTLDWQSFDPETFPYVLRQREGSENTMGVLKFVFANNYNVYLHDTNAKRLFNREQRALSHGCVRVNKAVQLAHYLAKDDDTYVSPEDLDQYLLLQRRLEVQVVKPINLYLQYFTCVEEDGKIVFYDDLYKKDKKMFMVLTNQIEEELASDY